MHCQQHLTNKTYRNICHSFCFQNNKNAYHVWIYNQATPRFQCNIRSWLGDVATWRSLITRRHPLWDGTVATGRPLIQRQHPLWDGTIATWRPLIPRRHPLLDKTVATRRPLFRGNICSEMEPSRPGDPSFRGNIRFSVKTSQHITVVTNTPLLKHSVT